MKVFNVGIVGTGHAAESHFVYLKIIYLKLDQYMDEIIRD